MVITPNIIDLSVAHSKGRINWIESNENPYIQESNVNKTECFLNVLVYFLLLNSSNFIILFLKYV